MDAELEDFKTNINLTEYAAHEGYILDRRASSRNSVVMRKPDGDKIVIARGEDGHWIYFSVHEYGDNGSIIDFVQNRQRCKLGRVRQELRPWTGGGQAFTRPHPDLFRREIEAVSKDRAQVLGELARMKPLSWHRYLEEERQIPRSLLQSPRFAGRIRIDRRMNVIFPHADPDGPCGYEIKNRNFTGFAKGGEKALWFSAARAGDTALVIAETGIDALSHAALHPDDNARYASIAGAMNPGQPDLIRAAAARMGQGASILIATDNDPDGRKLAGQIETAIREASRPDLRIVRDLPEGEGEDWNDRLRDAARSRTSGNTHAPGPGPRPAT
jgi:hypothetical protein